MYMWFLFFVQNNLKILYRLIYIYIILTTESMKTVLLKSLYSISLQWKNINSGISEPKLMPLISTFFLPNGNYITQLLFWTYLDWQQGQNHNKKILVLFSLSVPVFPPPLHI